MQHPDILLQHQYETLATFSETFEILETYAYNMRFHRNISLLLARMETHRRVEFTRSSGIGDGLAATAAT